MSRMLVCGGRNFGNLVGVGIGHPMYRLRMAEFIFTIITLETYFSGVEWMVASGKATGADTTAEHWANYHNFPFIGYPAKWKDDPKGAGFKRNEEMLEKFKPTIVIAFPGGNGTAHMFGLAKDAGLPVHMFQYYGASK